MLDSLLTRHKPDILDCIANLSNDEVFTPPAVANKMLDLLPPEVWTNPELRFLDPGCKSGVFLREAAKRLMKGLEEAIPDEGARREHIFKNMLHGIAITELTAQISRRTLYYSKDASSEQSVVQLPTADGNIRYQNIAHTFKAGSCVHCGAPEAAARDLEALESHAYLFIHEELDPTMKFDVIIGNPPYQLKDGGHGASASPLYHKFVEQAKKANPKYMSMIIPSRWFAGGKGLDAFRAQMLSDRHLRVLADHADASDCFPGVEIGGGVSYFLWDADYDGDCTVRNVSKGEVVSEMARNLKEFPVLIRDNSAVSIVNKVVAAAESSYKEHVLSRKPFGMSTFFDNTEKSAKPGLLKLYAYRRVEWVDPKFVTSNSEHVQAYKVLTSKAYAVIKDGAHQIIGTPFVIAPGEVCTETYIVCGSFQSKLEAENCLAFLKTKFVRFLISLKRIGQDINRDKFHFVPKLDMSESWDDAKLYTRYGLTADEIAYIESTIKEMA